jgi:hypothetical protein
MPARTTARTQASAGTSREVVEEERSRLRKQSIAIPSDFLRFEISALHILGLNVCCVCGGEGVGEGVSMYKYSVGQSVSMYEETRMQETRRHVVHRETKHVFACT